MVCHHFNFWNWLQIKVEKSVLYKMMFCVDSFLLTWHILESSERMEQQLENVYNS